MSPLRCCTTLVQIDRCILWHANFSLSTACIDPPHLCDRLQTACSTHQAFSVPPRASAPIRTVLAELELAWPSAQAPEQLRRHPARAEGRRARSRAHNKVRVAWEAAAAASVAHGRSPPASTTSGLALPAAPLRCSSGWQACPPDGWMRRSGVAPGLRGPQVSTFMSGPVLTHSLTLLCSLDGPLNGPTCPSHAAPGAARPGGGAAGPGSRRCHRCLCRCVAISICRCCPGRARRWPADGDQLSAGGRCSGIHP